MLNRRLTKEVVLYYYCNILYCTYYIATVYCTTVYCTVCIPRSRWRAKIYSLNCLLILPLQVSNMSNTCLILSLSYLIVSYILSRSLSLSHLSHYIQSQPISSHLISSHLLILPYRIMSNLILLISPHLKLSISTSLIS